MKIYPVSHRAKHPVNADSRCIEPVLIDRDLFEEPWWGNERISKNFTSEKMLGDDWFGNKAALRKPDLPCSVRDWQQ
ncbi:MAG TPA: hypothetical protein VF480_06790, partial [Verrucomicrobiae bacterium]